MEELKKRLNKFMSLDFFNMIMESPEDYLTIFIKRFDLSDLGITSRVLNHWKDYGLLPDEDYQLANEPVAEEPEKTKDPSYKMRNKFDFVGLIYLYIIQDLRDFGFPLSKIKKVREVLFSEIDLFDVLATLHKQDISMIKKQVNDDRMMKTGSFLIF